MFPHSTKSTCLLLLLVHCRPWSARYWPQCKPVPSLINVNCAKPAHRWLRHSAACLLWHSCLQSSQRVGFRGYQWSLRLRRQDECRGDSRWPSDPGRTTRDQCKCTEVRNENLLIDQGVAASTHFTLQFLLRAAPIALRPSRAGASYQTMARSNPPRLPTAKSRYSPG